MAIDDADQSDSKQLEGEVDESAAEPEGNTDQGGDGPDPTDGGSGTANQGPTVSVGEYTWAEFMEEFGYEDEVNRVYPSSATSGSGGSLGLGSSEDVGPPSGDDWNGVEFAPEEYLGFHPDDLTGRITEDAAPPAKYLWEAFKEDVFSTPVVKDEYGWEHFKWEYYYEDEGDLPLDSEGETVPFEPESHLGFDPEDTEGLLSQGQAFADELHDVIEERTVNVRHEKEDEFFSTQEGHTTVVNRYDLEKAVPQEKKTHFREEDRYWVNKPYAFVILFHSEKENEKKYYAIEPNLNEIEKDLQEFLTGKLRTAIKYTDEDITIEGGEDERKDVIERETKRLLKRYDIFQQPTGGGGDGSIINQIKGLFGEPDEVAIEEEDGGLDGISLRPEPAILADDPDHLNEYQVEKLLYLLKRDFIGYERIDPIKHDINVEDISCNGYNSPVFVYHTDHEQIISNIYHAEEELDDFVVKLAQRSGKGISKRRPQVDATLPDGSRSQLTLGPEVSDHGTNYTIRQFKDVPFTPIDLINWNTFSLDEMAFLWLSIENHKSLIFAGGTASGKTTSLNAISLFIPSSAKIVSIEDTREVELPQRNWIASVTRPSFSDDSQGDVDEFDLLEAALRQRPDYIVMGEIRGEEGRTLFQVMSTGHTTYTTFHADSVGEVLKRFTTDPINVSKTMFTALDLVSIQTQTRVQGNKVRRNKSLTEINHYDAENDEINVQDVYQWQAETDEFLKMGDSNTLEEIQFDRGWNRDRLEEELFERRVILAYLIKNGLNEYTKVAATVQAYINDPETILTLIANDQLEDSLEDLREMESVLIDVDPEKEALVPRPDAGEEIYNEATDILERAEERVFEQYRGKVPSGLGSALSSVSGEEEPTITPEETDSDDFDFGGGGLDDSVSEDELGLGDDDDFTFGSTAEGDEAVAEDGPGWLSDDEDEFGGTESDGETGVPETAEGDAGDGTDTPELDEAEETAALAASGAEADAAETDDSPPDETEAGSVEETATASSADGTREDGADDTDEAVFSDPTGGDAAVETADVGAETNTEATETDDVPVESDDAVFSSGPEDDPASDGTVFGEPNADEAEGTKTPDPTEGTDDPGNGTVDDEPTEEAGSAAVDDAEDEAEDEVFSGDSSFFGDEDSSDESGSDESIFSDSGSSESPFGDSEDADGDTDGEDAIFEDDGESIFGETDGDSIFSESDENAGDEAETDTGSVFDDGDGSIFSDSDDEDEQ
ncbi:ATPase, T2SS/T4P/T4SS family [Halostella pelagica]|uniref:ATPase, T2SS/T4P/T4SS family n=1 Tax=Halostella pelagica TaxID=2583824 RepID=UPI0010803159